MVLTLYKTDVSAPVRSVYLTAKVLGITMDYVEVDVLKNENKHPDFIKLNPQHTVPTLVDGDKVLWDSHAINVYLITKYGHEDHPLYPENPYQRAIINQRLYFDSGVLFPKLVALFRALCRTKSKKVPNDLAEEVAEAYQFLNKFLDGHKWMTGDNLTLADFQLITTVTAMNLFLPIDPIKCGNVMAWIKSAEKLPYYDLNSKGLQEFAAYVQKEMAA